MKRIKKLSFLILTLCAVFSLLAFSAAALENDFTLNPELILNPQTSLSVFVDDTADPALSGDYPYGEAVELNAPSVAGKTFLYWTNDEGAIISYNSSLKVKMYANTALSAVYGTSDATAQTTAAFLNISRTDGEIIFNAIATANGSITETGIRYSTTKSSLEDLKGTDGVTVEKADDSTSNWTLTVTPADDATTYYAVVYTTVGAETTYSAVKAVKLSELQSAASPIINLGGLNGVNIDLCNVTFNANGGEGAMLPQGMLKNTATALNANTITRRFHTFNGWNTAANGTGEGYSDGQTVTLNEDLTLYAQWTENTQTITAENVTVTYGDTGKSVSASVTDPAEGGGTLSYAVKSGSEDYIEVDPSTGALIIKAVPPTDGKACVTVTATETDIYAQTTKDVTVTIAQKEIGLTWGSTSLTYNGEAQNPAATATGLVDGDTCAVTVTGAQTNEGSYTATATALSNANYKLPSGATTDFTIAKKDVTITGLSASNKTYDGTATAAVTGNATIYGKVEGDDVSVAAGTASFADKNAGGNKNVTFSGYSLTGTDAGNYNLTAQPASVKASITVKDVTITGLSASDKTYDGTAMAAVTGNATIDGKVESDDVSVTAGTAFFADKNAGDNKNVTFSGYSLTGTDAGNYNLTAQPAVVTASISAKRITATADDKSSGYKSDLAELTWTLSDNALVAGDSEESLKINASTDATPESPAGGTYTITLTQGEEKSSNYDVTLNPGTYTITEADAIITASAYSGAYDGQEHGIIVEVKDETNSILDLISSFFGSNPQKAEATVYYSTESSEGAMQTKNTTVPTRKDVGQTTVYYAVVFGGNYKADLVTGSKDITITEKEVGLSWRDTSFTYDGQSHVPTATATGLANGDICTVTLTGAQTNAGEYTATATELSNPNYKLPAQTTQSFTIAPAEVGLSWSNTSFTYDGKSHVPTATATGLEEGDTCTVTVEGVQTNAGTYTATAAKLSNGNYKLPAQTTQSFTIAPAEVGLSWRDTSFTYDGKSHAPTATATGLVGRDTCTVTVTGAQKNAGKHTATATALSNANYVLPAQKTQSFTISSKAKANQKAPAAPVITKITGTSITVTTVKGVEYSIDGKHWQTKGTFSNLTMGKVYSVRARRAETANYKASPAVKVRVKTLNPSTLLNLGFKISQGNGKMTVKYGLVPGATGYRVSVQYCGKNGFTEENTVTVKSGSQTSATITKLNGAALDQTKDFKVKVEALKGSKVIGTSRIHHEGGRSQTRYTNAKAIKLNKTAVTLKAKKTFTLQPTVTKWNEKKPLLSTSHGAYYRYATSDSVVATVDSNGKITAKAPGTCVVYVIAQNGRTAQVTVTVK